MPRETPEPPEIEPYEPGGGVWAAIGKLILLAACMLVIGYAMTLK